MNATNPLESSESDNIVFVDAEESEESFMNNSFFKKDRKFLNDFENLEVEDRFLLEELFLFEISAEGGLEYLFRLFALFFF